MELRQLINEMREYLESLSDESALSPKAEAGRLRLLARLAISYSPPPAYYLDMSRSNPINQSTDKMWNVDNSYEVMVGCGGGPPPVYTNTMPDVLSSSKRLSSVSLGSTSANNPKSHTRGVSLTTLNNSNDSYLVANVPQHSSTVPVRSGPLTRRKRRRPSFLPPNVSHYWAALTGTTLHLYRGASTKHTVTVDLAGYQARTVIPSRGDHAFEVFSPGKKTLQFIAPTAADMDGWLTSIREGCSTANHGNIENESGRELPEPPHQDHYDVPDSRVRPVLYHHRLSHYSNIAPSPKQEHVYKNVDDLKEGDSPYYNIVGASRGKDMIKAEEIYQTIGDNQSEEYDSNENKQNRIINQRNCTGRVQQIVKAMENQDCVDSKMETAR